MNVTIVDYNSGNISSVINSFKEVAKDKVNIEVTSNLNKIKSSDKVVLPGQGSFKSCVDALNNISGLVETLNEFVPSDKSVISSTTDYASNIVSSVEKENIFGTQFHPEKSDKIGLRIIENFITL